MSVLALTSCSKSGLVNAKGRLTYKGKGVPSTHVFFWPEEEGKRRSTGLTDDNGYFTLSYSRTEPGVLVGKHTVFVKYYVSVEEELHILWFAKKAEGRRLRRSCFPPATVTRGSRDSGAIKSPFRTQ